MQRDFDVIIVGAGIVGTSLALLLAKSGLTIALVEAQLKINSPEISEPARTIVLAASSQSIFESMQVWPKLMQQVCPIKKIHVSDRGHFGTTRILASDEKLSALGYVVSAQHIDYILSEELQRYPNIHLFQPAQFVAYQYEEESANVHIEYNGEQVCLSAKLLVGADGHNSSIRNFLQIKVNKQDYQQTAIICNVLLKRPHVETAYERFTEQGPLALLPLLDQKAAVIWTVNKNNKEKILSLSEKEFIKELQHHFGYRMGQISSSSARVGIDLQLVAASQQIAPGAVLLGNSVHTLHPVAGQGLNIALRDMAVLAEEIVTSKNRHYPLGNMDVLQRYLNRRKNDQQQIIALTHSLVGVFSNSLLPVVLARNVSMLLLDRVKWLKRILTRRTLGLAGKVPRLACGLNLE